MSARAATLLYLGAIPWVFHEAYAWSIAMTLGSAHALIGCLGYRGPAVPLQEMDPALYATR